MAGESSAIAGADSEAGDALVLDLCCGTGDLALALARVGPARVMGADFAHPMLVQAIAKSGAKIPFLEADALRLPFADASFDLLTAAFGFRNLANYEEGLREMMRVLKPGGTLAILEFTEPPEGFLGNLYRWYFRGVLPRIGGMLSGDHDAYTYLPRSVSRFFRPAQLRELMESVRYYGGAVSRMDDGYGSFSHRATESILGEACYRPWKLVA